MAVVSVTLLIFIQIVVLVLPSSADPTGTKCAPAPGRSESCVCQTKDGIIDMTSLSNDNGTARCERDKIILDWCRCRIYCSKVFFHIIGGGGGGGGATHGLRK